MNNVFSSLLSSLINVAKETAGVEVLALIVKFTNSVAANPTQINIVAQAASFQAQLLGIIPTLAQAELSNLANIINTEAAKLLTPAPAVAAV